MFAQAPNCSDTTYVPIITVSGITAFSPITICFGDTIILTAENGYDAYLWSTGDTTQSISVSDSGNYFVNALVDTCWFGSDTIEINISNPQPTIIAVGNDLITQAFATYQWYFNHNPITGATSQIYNAIQSGCYYVIVIDENLCMGQSEPFGLGVSCNTSIEVLNDFKISFYPNPAINQITLELPEEGNYKNAELSIMTITGQMVKQLIIGNEQLTINVEHLDRKSVV